MSENSLYNEIKLLVLQSTPFCNIDCDYCYLPDRLSTKRMPLEKFERLLRKVFESNLIGSRLKILWHAGEPLVMPISYYERAFQLAEAVNQGRTQIVHAIQTNGTLLSEKWCDLFKAWNVNVGISIDGPAFIHDARRKTRTKKGTHAETMRGVSLLQANNIDFSVLAVITRLSLSFPDEIFNFFLDHQITMVGFNHEETVGAHVKAAFDVATVQSKLQKFMERIYQLVKEHNECLLVRELWEAEAAVERGVQLEKLTNPFIALSMDWEGNLTTYSPEMLGQKNATYGNFNLGNISTDSIEGITQHPMFQRMNTDIQAGVKLCSSICEYFSMCGGGNPVHKFFENGTFRSAETLHCKFHVQIPIETVLGYIEKNL